MAHVASEIPDFNYIVGKAAARGVVSAGLNKSGEYSVLLLEADGSGKGIRFHISGVSMFWKLLDKPSLKGAISGCMLPSNNPVTYDEVGARIRQTAATPAHGMESCQIGVDEAALVDPECWVRGIAHLRVVALSVLPSHISCNPDASAMTLGDRISDMILGKPPLPRSIPNSLETQSRRDAA